MPTIAVSLAPSLRARKQQFIRSAIWDTATDLFAEMGYDETTVEDIAQKAGVSRRSFFRYFSSKSDLMAYGVEGYGERIAAAIAACPAGDSLSEVIRTTVYQVAGQSAAQPRARKVMQIAAKYPAAAEALQSRTTELQERVAAAFAKRNRKRAADMAAELGAGLTLCILGQVLRAWFEHETQDISTTVESALSALVRMVCAG